MQAPPIIVLLVDAFGAGTFNRPFALTADFPRRLLVQTSRRGIILPTQNDPDRPNNPHSTT